jgi:drug/metabolite transporter (DMT)-like permease
MTQQEKSKRSDLVGDMLEQPSSRISGALVLIVLGAAFLLRQNNLLPLTANWWALAIFVPAAVMLYNAYTAYNRAEHVTPAVRRQLSSGLVMLVVAVIAATGQWSTLWPLFLIVPGVQMLLGKDQQRA